MTILIADDERMVRLGLKSMLDELYPNKYTYIEAKNGRELIELTQTYRPDIGFVDIKMPLMNGLDALEQIKNISPNTQWLILSGYADFEYARCALRLGAIEYLLKPISIEELEKVIKHASENIHTQIEKSNSYFTLNVITAYNMYQSLDLEDISIQLKQFNNYKIYVFYIDNWNKSLRNSTYQMLIDKIKKYMNNKIDFEFKYCLYFLTTGELCLITCGNMKFGNSDNFINSTINESNEAITVFSKKENTITALFKNCQDIIEISSVRAVYGYGKLLYLDNINIDYLMFSSKLEDLCLAFIQRQEIEYKNIIDELDRNYKKMYELIDKNCIKSYFLTSIGIDINVDSHKSFVDSLIKSKYLMYANNSIETDFIVQITDYIKQNYMNDIGINSIAQLLNISPNYLSKIFHQRVGKKFIDFLTEIRITNAKKLFSYNPNLTVKDVATKVGYTSTRHFTKTFTKIVKCLPSEYIYQLKTKSIKL